MYIIAEIGVNHDGCVKKAMKLVDAAHQAGADCVKFQSFKAKKLARDRTPKVLYQKSLSNQETHLQMLESLELSKTETASLIEHCSDLGIDFLSTPYDQCSLNELLDLGCQNFKVASADIVDFHLHNKLVACASSVFISSGMATETEIRECLGLYQNSNVALTLLHCTSSYPCPDGAVNLKVMNWLKDTFSLPVGFSDHSIGKTAGIAACLMGASVLEKHFTLNKNDLGPDHAASAEPLEFQSMVREIKRLPELLGDGLKRVMQEEVEMRQVSRKSLVWATSIQPGQVVTEKHLVSMRPGDGVSPMLAPTFIGRTVAREGLIGENVSPSQFCD